MANAIISYYHHQRQLTVHSNVPKWTMDSSCRTTNRIVTTKCSAWKLFVYRMLWLMDMECRAYQRWEQCSLVLNVVDFRTKNEKKNCRICRWPTQMNKKTNHRLFFRVFFSFERQGTHTATTGCHSVRQSWSLKTIYNMQKLYRVASITFMYALDVGAVVVCHNWNSASHTTCIRMVCRSFVCEIEGNRLLRW